MDLGEPYETRIAALLSLKCCLEDLEHFWIASNVNDCGYFGDLVFFRKERNKEGITYLMQLRYQDNNKEMKTNHFMTRKGRFSLLKYLDSYVQLSDAISDQNTGKSVIIDHLRRNPRMVYYIFYTNKDVGTKIEFLNPMDSHSDPINVKGNVYGFNPDIFNSEELKDFARLGDHEKSFAKNILLYAKQPHPKEIDAEIKKIFKELIGTVNRLDRDFDEIVRKFVVFIDEWSRGWLGGHYLLTKEQVLGKVTEILLQPFMVNFNEQIAKCEGKQDEKRFSLWNEMIKDKKLIVVNESDEVIEKFMIRFVAVHIDSEENFKITSKDLLRIHDDTVVIPSSEFYEYLWKTRKIPLVVQVSYQCEIEEVKKILELAQETFQIIILNKRREMIIDDLKSSKSLFSVLDLKEEQQNELFSCPIRLQGRYLDSLEKLNLNIRTVLFDLKVKDIIYILSGKFNIGGELGKLPDVFAKISLLQVWLKPEVLQNVNDDIFVIHTVNVEAFDHFIQEKLNTEASKIIKWKGKGSFKSDFHKIILYDRPHILKIIEDYFKNRKISSIHFLIFHYDSFEWVKSWGSIKSLKEFRISQKFEGKRTVNRRAIINFLKKDKSIIISSNPGMGKSVLTNYLALMAPSNVWSVKLNLAKYQNNYKNFTNLSDLFHQHLEEECKQNLSLAKVVFEKYNESKNIIVLLDGFDEIPARYRNDAKQFVKFLNESGYFIFITTRPVLKNDLESLLNTFSLELDPLTKANQEMFLTTYFSKCTKTGRKTKTKTVFVQRLLSAVRNNLNDHDDEFMSVPLQTIMLAEIFMEDFKTFMKTKNFMNQRFDLLEMFKHFTSRKMEIAFEKSFKISKDILSQYKNLKTLYALSLLFSEEDLKGLQITSKLECTKLMFPDMVELIQKDGIIVAESDKDFKFVHKSFAEFLVGEWLAENIKNENREVAKRLFKATFEYDLKVSRYIFDRILANACPLHLAVINFQVDKAIALIDSDHLDDLDGGNRSFLHLLASWGCRFSKRVFNFQLDVVWFESEYCTESLADDEMLKILKSIPEEKLHNFKDQILEYTPIDYAMMNHSFHIANMLCQKIEKSVNCINVKNRYANSVLNLFYEMGYLSLIRAIINSIDSEVVIDQEDQNSLSCIVSRGNIEKLKELISLREDLNIKDKFGLTPLHVAVKTGMNKVVKILIDNGSDTNVKDINGKTALHYSVILGNYNISKLLLSKGTDLNIVDIHRRTPLHYAMISHPKYSRDILYLLRDANFNAVDELGSTPFLLAAKFDHMECVKVFSRSGFDIDQKDINQWTALHWAAKLGHVVMVQILFLAGANINARTIKGTTPLMCAASCGHGRVVCLLLDRGADAEAKDDNNMSAYHWAALHGHKDVVTLLTNRKYHIRFQRQLEKYKDIKFESIASHSSAPIPAPADIKKVPSKFENDN